MRGTGTSPWVGCARRGSWSATCEGRDPDEALDLARQCVADGLEALVVCGGRRDGALGAQAVAEHDHQPRHHPGRHRQRRGPLLRHPAQGPAGRRGPGRSRRATKRIDLARSGSKYFVTVLAAGFDAVVNERANKMTWPKGQMRYNLATIAELRTFEPLPYTLELDGADPAARRDARGRRQRRVVRRWPADHRGRQPRRRPARRRHHQADEQARPVRTYPKLFKGTHVTHPQYEHHLASTVTVAAPGIVSYADGERFGALPLTIEAPQER